MIDKMKNDKDADRFADVTKENAATLLGMPLDEFKELDLKVMQIVLLLEGKLFGEIMVKVREVLADVPREHLQSIISMWALCTHDLRPWRQLQEIRYGHALGERQTLKAVRLVVKEGLEKALREKPE